MSTLWNIVSVYIGGRWHRLQFAFAVWLNTSKPFTASSEAADLSPLSYLSHGEFSDLMVRTKVAIAFAMRSGFGGPPMIFSKAVLYAAIPFNVIATWSGSAPI